MAGAVAAGDLLRIVSLYVTRQLRDQAQSRHVM
jgi:hypothetical protein